MKKYEICDEKEGRKEGRKGGRKEGRKEEIGRASCRERVCNDV